MHDCQIFFGIAGELKMTVLHSVLNINKIKVKMPEDDINEDDRNMKTLAGNCFTKLHCDFD